VVQLTRETLFDQASGSRQQALFRVLPLQHRLLVALPAVEELPWLRASTIPEGAKVLTDLSRPGLSAEATSLTSDTGELMRDWQRGLFTIDTPRSQGAVGWLGEAGPVTLADCTIRVTNPKAAVILSSLDGRPLRQSGRILVTAVARAVGRRTRGGTVVSSEPVAATLSLHRQGGALVLVPLAGNGDPGAPVPGSGRNGAVDFVLPADQNTHWFLLKSEER
jgi:hypothetical protein